MAFETDEERKAALPLNAPKCACFDFDDHDYAMGRCSAASTITSRVAMFLLDAAKEFEFCPESLQFMVDTLNIQLATHMATHGTIIEQGTKEVRWETERILTGVEARLMAVLAQQYALADKLGLTAAKVAAKRAEGRIQ